MKRPTPNNDARDRKIAAVRRARTADRARKRRAITAQARDIGDRMRTLRDQRGLSQLDIAEACAVTRAAVSLWERGETLPEPDNLQRAAKRLRCPLRWLSDGEGAGPADIAPAAPGAARRALRYVDTADAASWSDDPARPPFEGAVPEIASGVGAGMPYQPHEQVRDWWRLPPSLLAETLRTTASSLRVFQVRADTMEPDIRRGSHVFIDLGQTTPHDGGIFALDNGISIVLKRIALDAARSDVIGLRDGPKIDWVAIADVKIVGRVVGHFAYL